jgi:hypothetical protein
MAYIIKCNSKEIEILNQYETNFTLNIVPDLPTKEKIIDVEFESRTDYNSAMLILKRL